MVLPDAAGYTYGADVSFSTSFVSILRSGAQAIGTACFRLAGKDLVPARLENVDQGVCYTRLSQLRTIVQRASFMTGILRSGTAATAFAAWRC